MVAPTRFVRWEILRERQAAPLRDCAKGGRFLASFGMTVFGRAQRPSPTRLCNREFYGSGKQLPYGIVLRVGAFVLTYMLLSYII